MPLDTRIYTLYIYVVNVIQERNVSPRPKTLAPDGSELQQAIKETAWQQIAEQGAAALSLRAIARALKITAPAIYNYYPSRDDLVTALIVDAYTLLGETQRAALGVAPEEDLAGRFRSLGLAYRAWAVNYPQRYQLIFGTPLPGYTAPADTTIPAAQWSLQPLISVLAALKTAGRLRVERSAPLTPELQHMLSAWQSFGAQAELEVLYHALVVWSRVHGLVMLEIGGQMPSFFHDAGELFRREIENMQRQYLDG